MDTQLADRLADYRVTRRDLEASVLPLATSVDGRRFSFQAPLQPLELRVGGYVMLESPEARRLGQVESLAVTSTDAADSGDSHVRVRLARGEGAVLDGEPVPFHDALIRPADTDEIREWLRRTAPRRALLPAGTLLHAPDITHALDAGGFNRHTFLCGQSGSGKTYALGVLLERLLLETDLHIVVLDPNSDFVRLHELRDALEPDLAERYRAAADGISIHRAGGPERLRVRLAELERAAQAALLRLDPVRDREEYAELVELLDESRPAALGELEDAQLAQRARNLGVDSWGVWARETPGSTLDKLGDDRCTIVDLGSLATPGEQALVSAAVLGRLWQRRAERRPVLIVIDEAHNVCPAQPADELTALATEYAIRIAAEGRKFGLYLLTSTQRPQKVAENIVSQCDNLVLMRMNSAADLDYARERFSFVPPGLLAQAATFRLGEALVAGKLSSHPALIKMGPRIAEEGGADVPATWAMAR